MRLHRQQRPRQRRAARGERRLVRADLAQLQLVAGEPLDWWEEEQRLAEDPSGGLAERITAGGVVALVSENRRGRARVEEREGAGRDVHPRGDETGDERVRAGIVDHVDAVCHVASLPSPWTSRRERRPSRAAARIARSVIAKPSAASSRIAMALTFAAG